MPDAPNNGLNRGNGKVRARNKSQCLGEVAAMIGVRTPSASDGDRGGSLNQATKAINKEARESGNQVQLMLNHEVHLFGVATPTHQNSKGGVEPGTATRDGAMPLQEQVMLMGVATPLANDSKGISYTTYSNGNHKKPSLTLLGHANQTLGENLYGFHAGTLLKVDVLTGQLNPRYSGWLMGYPISWDLAAIASVRLSKKPKREPLDSTDSETQSRRKSRPSSSKRTAKRGESK
ncbi:MAG: hypothetical protein JST51_01645 [Armatimonadetes bacterium]|nr:hypothetical protein [Armatimonadota bacterium]